MCGGYTEWRQAVAARVSSVLQMRPLISPTAKRMALAQLMREIVNLHRYVSIAAWHGTEMAPLRYAATYCGALGPALGFGARVHPS